nr:carboxymuconolactone decarboxylase family protein [Falsirhodobacter halotolerans]
MPALAQEAALGAVSPALQDYLTTTVDSDLWSRPHLAPRDRSIVTVSALIARGQTADLPAQVDRAFANGVTPTELSEIVTHLAFYAGVGTAQAAAPIIAAAFEARDVVPADLPGREVELLPQDADGEATRVQAVDDLLGDAVPGLATFTTDPLFAEVWLRPGLEPRDRSLVTITSLIALGQTEQLSGHLNRALANGLTATEAGEVVTHLAFYSGWPAAFSAGPVVKEVLDAR